MKYRKALLVVDDPVLRERAAHMFLDAGAADVALAEDGEQAVAALNAGLNPDLIVCDLDRPMHDGVTLIRALADRRFPGGVLVISGEAHPVIASVTKLAGMHDLDILGSIRKPLTEEKLAAMLPGTATAQKSNRHRHVVQPSLLDAAIERGALHPFFQAKVSMADGSIAGAEALARIATSPSDFADPVPYVELAERNNRIDELTVAMTRLVAHHAKGFQVEGKPLPVAINISPASLRRRDFPDVMAAAVESARVPPSQVTLEVTETRPVEYGPEALETLSRLRIQGFGLSVDDYGAGYSNIERLQMYPFTELKIDQSFTRNALREARARARIETSVRVAKELGLKVVAEGVETSEMWSFLADLGVDEAQGFLMARPMPAAEFAKLLAQGLPRLGASGRLRA